MNLMKLLSYVSDVDQLLTIPDLIDDYECNTYVKESNGKYLGCNDNQAKHFGMESHRRVVGLSDSEFLCAGEARVLLTNDSEVMRSKSFKIFMENFTAVNGKSFIATSIKMPLRTKTNKIIGISGLSILRESNPNDSSDNHGLTKRQLDCLLLSIKGRSMKLVAKELELSPRTVEHYLETAKQKLNSESKVELYEKALQIPYIKNRL